MAEVVAMPKWGLTMQEGTIVEWLAEPGDHVQEGTALARVETDKIEVELEAPVAGVVAAHIARAGATVPVGEPVVVIARDEADYEAYHQGAGQ
jgi:pyruvate/2-oxoglutarate dehydrogenase complex dihydrolipoamide acyltransferase (E2) component